MTNTREHVANTPTGEPDLNNAIKYRKYDMLRNLRISSQVHHEFDDKWSVKSTKATSTTPLIIKPVKPRQDRMQSSNIKMHTPISPLLLLKPVPFKDRSIQALSPLKKGNDVPNHHILECRPSLTHAKKPNELHKSEVNKNVFVDDSIEWKRSTSEDNSGKQQQRSRRVSRWSDLGELESDVCTVKQTPFNVERLNKSYSIERMQLLKKRKLRMKNVNRTCHRNRWRKRAVLSWLEQKYGKVALESGLIPKPRAPIKLLKKEENKVAMNMDRPFSPIKLNLEDYFSTKELSPDFTRCCFESAEQFVIRKEQITYSHPWQTVTTFTFNRICPFRYT